MEEKSRNMTDEHLSQQLRKSKGGKLGGKLLSLVGGVVAIAGIILGGNIVLLNEANNYKAMTPDYIWNGKMWDLKTASTEKSANSAVRHGLKQIQENPGGIILNYGQNIISADLLKEVLRKRLTASATQDVDILVIYKDELLMVQRFIAKK